MNKDQDSEAISHIEVPEDMDADSSARPVVPEYSEVPGTGARYEGNT